MGVEPSGRAQEAMTAALDLARRFVSRYYPDVEAALLAGSRMRGEATSGSDYDVVLLFRALPEGAWRAMSLFEGRHIEMFAHDLATLAYFCREVDRPSGMAALPTMIAEGVALVTRSPTTLEAARQLAHETLRLGPPEPDQAAIRARRYALTDLATALDGSHETHIRIAAGLRFTLRLPTSPCARPTDGAPPARRFHGCSGQWTRISPYGSRRHFRRCSPPAMSLPWRDWSMSFSHLTGGDCARGSVKGRRPNGE